MRARQKKRWIIELCVAAASVCVLTGAEPGTDSKPAIDPAADAAFRRMSDYLAKKPSFSVNAEVWQDLDLRSGQRVQAGRTVEIQVRRPDRFHAEIHSTRQSRGLYYDGKAITLLNRVGNFYGAIPAPSTLDEALDLACERFGITMPLEDLIVADPYRSAMRNVVSGCDLGPVSVLGIACEHLAFSQNAIDWQIWIETGSAAVPRKLVITYKDEAGSPQYTATLSNWDFEAKFPDSTFSFQPPVGGAKIDVAEIKALGKAHKSEGQ